MASLFPTFDPKKAETDKKKEPHDPNNPRIDDTIGGLVQSAKDVMFAPTNQGNQYEPGGRTAIPRLNAEPNPTLDANRQINTERYNNTGEPMFGVEGMPRTMPVLDDQGNKSTEFVMPPELVEGTEPLLEGSARVAGNAITKAAKGTLSFGEWLLDNATKSSKAMDKNPDLRKAMSNTNPLGAAGMDWMRQLGEYADKLLGTNISNEDTNFTDENFPTLPTTNNLEEFGGTAGAMIVGAGAGAKSGQKLTKEVIEEFFKRAKDVNPKSAKALTQRFTHAAAKLTGESAGATVMTPDNTESYTGSHFLDNFILGGAFNAVGAGIGGVARWIDKVPLAGLNRRPSWDDSLANFMRSVDPTVTAEMTKEELVRRAKLFGNVVNSNKKFETGLSGVEDGMIDLDTSTALAMNDAARQYVRGVVNGPVSDEYVDQLAQRLVENMRGVKKGRISGNSAIIEASDSNINARTEQLLSEKANNIQDPSILEKGVGSMLEPQISDLQAANQALKRTNANVIGAEGRLLAEQNDNALMRAIEDAKANDLLGFNTEAKGRMRQMSTEQLTQAWRRDYENVQNLYRNIPRETYDYESLADAIIAAGDQDTALAALNVVPAGRTVNEVTGSAEQIATQRAALVDGLRTRFPDVNVLWNEGRSVLSRKVDQAFKANDDATQTLAVRDAIDNIVNSNQNPQIQAAQRAYAEYKQTWLQTDQLRAVDEAMHNVGPNDQGIIPAQQKGYEALQSALNDPTSLELDPLLAALGDPAAEASIREYAVGEILSRLSRGMTSDQLIGQLQRVQNLVHNVSPPMEQEFITTIRALQAAEGNVEATKVAMANAQRTAATIMNQAAEKEASSFIVGLEKTMNVDSAGPSLTTNIPGTFKQIFDSKESVGRVTQLMSEARASGNPVVVDGIKSQALRWLKDKAFSSNSTGATVVDGDVQFSHAPRLGNLKNIVEGSSDNTLSTLKAIFEDDPQTFAAIQNTLDFINTKVNLDTAKAFTKGSDTARNTSAAESVKTLSTAWFGPLSRPGTIVNKLANLIFGENDKQIEKVAMDMLDVLIVDPAFFKKVAASSTGKDTGALEGFVTGTVQAAKRLGQAKMADDKEANRTTEGPYGSVNDQTNDALRFTSDPIGDMINQTEAALSEPHGKLWREAQSRPRSTNIEDRRLKSMEDLQRRVEFPNDWQAGQFRIDSFARANGADYPARALSKGDIDSPSSKGFSKRPK